LVYTIRGLHSLGLVLAQAFQNITPPAQSSPLIALGLKLPAAWERQHSSLPAPVGEKTAAGISFHFPDANPVWSTYCTTHSGGCLKSGIHLHSGTASCPCLLIQQSWLFSSTSDGKAFLPRFVTH